MQIDKTGRGAGLVRSNEAAPTPQTDSLRHKADAPSSRRDVIVVNPKETRRAGKPSRYADALFLAHMFAAKFDVPQQREKRRADPVDANASYRDSGKRLVKAGRVLSKKI
jgi:hypothetical protein